MNLIKMLVQNTKKFKLDNIARFQFIW